MTDCYTMVRGSALRVTGLKPCGSIPDTVQYVVSSSVVNVTINEETAAGGSELIRNDLDQGRILIVTPTRTIRYRVDVNFLRVDPGMLSLVAGVPVVTNSRGDIVGFDADTRLPAAAFGLEVWSNIVGPCAGEREWGYTVFPFLKGGTLSGFEFANGLVSFNLRGARSQRAPKWSVGPYDLTGPHERLLEQVSRSTSWLSYRTPVPPPAQTDGIQSFVDQIDGGDAQTTSSDILDGEFVDTSQWIVDGGGA